MIPRVLGIYLASRNILLIDSPIPSLTHKLLKNVSGHIPKNEETRHKSRSKEKVTHELRDGSFSGWLFSRHHLALLSDRFSKWKVELGGRSHTKTLQRTSPSKMPWVCFPRSYFCSSSEQQFRLPRSSFSQSLDSTLKPRITHSDFISYQFLWNGHKLVCLILLSPWNFSCFCFTISFVLEIYISVLY